MRLMHLRLANVVAKVKKGRKTGSACRPSRRARLGFETLEGRELMTASPLAWTAPAGSHNIVMGVSHGTVQIYDFGQLVASRAVTAVSSISLTGSSGGQNLFQIYSSPANIQTTINAKGRDDVVVLGDPGANAASNTGPLTPAAPPPATLQGVLGGVSVVGPTVANGLQLYVVDSTDPNTHQAIINSNSVTGLTPAAINYSGVNSLTVYGSKGANSRYTINGGPARTVLNDGSSSDTVIVRSNAGGVTVNGMRGDVGFLYGAASGTNTFTATPAAGTIPAAATLSGPGYTNVLNNFSGVVAYSNSASDSAELTSADDPNGSTLVATPTDATLSGTGYSFDAVGFEHVTVDSENFSGHDVAMLTGASSGTNTLVASGNDATLSGPGYSLDISYFSTVNVTSKSAADTATLSGIAGSENILSASSVDAFMTGPGYTNKVIGFHTVTANGSYKDKAYLTGPNTGANNLSASPNQAYLSGAGYNISALGFANIYATSNSTSDTANLNGKGGFLSATPTQATVSGADIITGAGYFIQAANFSNVYEHLTLHDFNWTSSGKLLENNNGWTTWDSGFKTLAIGSLVSPNYVWDTNSTGVHYFGGSYSARATDIAVLLNGLHDASLRSALFPALVRDGGLIHKGMLDVFAAVESEGMVTSGSLQDLQTLLQSASTLGMPLHVKDLANSVINGQQANANFQHLDSNGNVVSTALGNLHVGSLGSQLTNLVNIWFLGMSEPTAAKPYSAVPGVLMGANPLFTEVHQGQVGDCWFAATLAATAAQQPGYIKNMFIYDGTNTVNGKTVDVYTVRFFVNGAARYVTVDTELPDGGNYYTKLQNGFVLWPALAEKAYAVANGAGYVQTNNANSNSYDALAGGWPFWALPAITGKGAVQYDTDPSKAASAIQAGQVVVLSSAFYPDSNLIVGRHGYALVGFDSTSSTPFKVYNPWGSDKENQSTATYEGHPVFGGLFDVDATFMSNNFGNQSVSLMAAPGSVTAPDSARASVALLPAFTPGARASLESLPAFTLEVPTQQAIRTEPLPLPAANNSAAHSDAVFSSFGAQPQERASARWVVGHVRGSLMAVDHLFSEAGFTDMGL